MNIEGPRPLKREETAALGRLLNACFRTKIPGDMLEQFPHFINEANLRNLFVILENGEIVSHAGFLLRSLAFEGLTLNVALVGGVATLERCRGRGYATRCMDAILGHARDSGAHLAWISGTRGLYTARGATSFGCMWTFRFRRAAPDAALDVDELSEGDIDAISALHRLEPVRFIRPREDWTHAFRSRWVMNWRTRFWGVRSAGELRAYLAMHEPRSPERPALLAEFAGDRVAAAAALPIVMDRMNIHEAEVRVSEADRAAMAAFDARAETRSLDTGPGTMLPILMRECMDWLRPRIAELCGQSTAEALAISEWGHGPTTASGASDHLMISIGERAAQFIGRAEFARFLFGAPERALGFVGDESVIRAIQPAFPLPTPWYGLNFV